MSVMQKNEETLRAQVQDGSEPHTFEPEFFKILHPAEDRHFWFTSRNRIISAAMEGIDNALAPGYWVMEGGCGSGNTLKVLDQCCAKGRIIGADLYGEGFGVARQRSKSTLMRLDLMQLPFRPKFSIVAMFDVLEHLPDDRAILASLHDALVDDGRLVLTVPRDPALWSDTDALVCHFRRYSDTDLAEKLRETGFDIEYQTPFMMAMRLLVPLSRKTDAAQQQGERWRERALENFRNELRVRPIINPLLDAVLSLESHWVRNRRTLPTGTSLLAIARKRRS